MCSGGLRVVATRAFSASGSTDAAKPGRRTLHRVRQTWHERAAFWRSELRLSAGGGGWLVSRGALDLWARTDFDGCDKFILEDCYKGRWWCEDVIISRCLVARGAKLSFLPHTFFWNSYQFFISTPNRGDGYFMTPHELPCLSHHFGEEINRKIGRATIFHSEDPEEMKEIEDIVYGTRKLPADKCVSPYKFCALEGQVCMCTGTVRYGAGDELEEGATSFTPPREVKGKILCSNGEFGKDPAPGSVKQCGCKRH